MHSRLQRSSRNRILHIDRVINAIPQQLKPTLMRQIEITTTESGPTYLPQPTDDSLVHQVRYATGTVAIVVGVTIVAGAVVLRPAP